MRNALPTLLAVAWLGACGAPPDLSERMAMRADSVNMAEETFDIAAFDTVAWESTQDAINRGHVVYSISCAKCHGETGRGNGNFVLYGDTLRPPSFLGPQWRYAADPVGLRERIFTGSIADMPYWGLVGLRYRDVDAVSTYISEYLRPR